MPHARPRLLPCMAIVLAGSMVLACPAAQAQYVWKDGKGQMHASDQPPPRGVADKDILRRPATARLAAAPSPAASAASAPLRVAASAPVDPELAQRRARAEQDAKARAQADAQRVAAQRAENCQRARAHLATLDAGTRLVRVTPQGERVVIDDAVRAREAAEARSVMASDCR